MIDSLSFNGILILLILGIQCLCYCVKGIRRCSGKKTSQEVRNGRYREGYDRFVGLCNFFVAGIDALMLFEVLVLKTLHLGLVMFLAGAFLLTAVIGDFIYRDDYFD